MLVAYLYHDLSPVILQPILSNLYTVVACRCDGLRVTFAVGPIGVDCGGAGAGAPLVTDTRGAKYLWPPGFATRNN